MNPAFFVTMAVKATVILVAAFVAAMFLRRKSASLRYAVWTAAVAAVLALPALSALLPSWPIGKSATPTAAIVPAPVTTPSLPSVPAPPLPSRIPLLAAIWAVGASIVVAQALAGIARAKWLSRHGRVLDIPELSRLARETGVRRPIKVLTSNRASMPLTLGLWRPVILLPEEAAGWSAELRRMVLRHELIHVHRLDWLTQIAARIACAFYWFHPLIWLAAAQLREERERSCDDRVLALGTRASLYAENLLGLARSLKPAQWSMEVAMAQPSGLEKRVAALLDPSRDRRPVRRRAASSIAVVAAAAAALLAPGIAPAQNSDITLSGIVYDVSKARVPNAIVTVANVETHGKEIAQTDATGAYKFAGIAAGTYNFEVKMPGFRPYQQNGVSLTPGTSRELDAVLDVGQIAETINVVGKRPPLQTQAQAPQRIRVGGNVQATKLLSEVKPVYPQDAQDRGIEGTVLLRAVISTDGGLLSVNPVNSLVDPELTQAALDAVRQWRYQPTLLNGVPVEVATTITVNFRLAP